jgi:hypothetical protein
MPGATRYAAVYPGLRGGAYTIWGEEMKPLGTVVINGGQVTSWRWPS